MADQFAWLIAGSEAASDLVLIQTSLLFLCKWRPVSNTIYINSEVCINTMSPAALLPFIGQVAEQTTVKWPISNSDIEIIFDHNKDVSIKATISWQSLTTSLMYLTANNTPGKHL